MTRLTTFIAATAIGLLTGLNDISALLLIGCALCAVVLIRNTIKVKIMGVP